ncbi:hypothetical protein [Sphingobacterium rhinopitheci]|uniref:hypothetical protein n=1 Tax=Sphingobacterium rhinopitheci TaxID=2781960 RepID=UPI001F51A96B|nr:hypothetical protein [Sphingobacterium rhinopitheci]MCI0922164.1 hypothetical protein [Sphingobacterium rhinopitheci]
MEEKNTYTDDFGAFKLPDYLGINPFVVPEDYFEHQKEEIINQIKVENRLTSSLNTKKNIPEGYFAELEHNILAKISEIKLKDEINSDGFEIPDNYFIKLEESIQTRIFEAQLKDKISNIGFEIPSDYFNSLESSITSKIAENNLKLVTSNDGFSTPTSYFETLADRIKDNITVDRLSDTLSSDGFVTPTNYFENLEQKIIAKIENDNTPIITLPKRTNWSRYSAAAVLLLIGIGSYFAVNNNTLFQSTIAEESLTRTSLQNISDDELVSYLAQVSDDSDQLLHLSKMIDNKSDASIKFNSELEDDVIEEYLNYML